MASTWSDPLGNAETIKANDIETLRAAIRAKIIGRRMGTLTPSDARSTVGDSVKAAHRLELIDQMEKIAP